MAMKNWDLIVFAADSTTPQNETRAALNNYLLSGGKLIYHDWGAYEYGAGSPLYATMGVSVLNNNFGLDPVHFWDASHPFFENVPELLSPQPAATFYGQKTNTAGGYPIAGYSDAPSPTNAAIIVSNKNRAVFKAFTDLQHGGADVDGDSQPDIVELWVNMIRLVGSHNILAIDDDYIHNPTLLEIAMIKTGKAYTITNLQGAFQNLVLQRWWDVILCASEGDATSTTTKDRLLSYVNAGGKLVYEDWSAGAGHPLNAALGYIFVTDVTSSTPVFWWRDSHPLFSFPFPTPEYTNLVDNYGIDSINVQPINGNFQALGGATTSPAANSANVVLGNNFRTVFKGFLDGNNTADTDGDTIADGEELWRNLIGFMTNPCLYCDDFDNTRLDSDWTVVKATWSESNGEMHGSGVKKAAVVATGFPGCEVCSFQATIKTAGGIGNKFWMLAWYKDKNNKIEVLFNEQKDKILFKQRVNGVIVSKTKIAATILPNTTYDVRIEHNGHDFGFYINGELKQSIPEFPGTTWNGTIGFEVKNTTLHVGDVFILP